MLPSALGGALAAPFQGPLTDSPFQRLFYDPDNTRVETWQRLMAYGTADTSGAVARQLAKLVATGDFTSADGALDFRAAMGGIEAPVLVVAGRLDRIAPTAAVRDGYAALGGAKEWLLVSRANGTVAEYGHMDLVVGERAPEEVWSRVLDFFTRAARQEQ
jgi:pimeloyl-ACP methyl ester carboxylesterase